MQREKSMPKSLSRSPVSTESDCFEPCSTTEAGDDVEGAGDDGQGATDISGKQGYCPNCVHPQEVDRLQQSLLFWQENLPEPSYLFKA